MTNIAIFASGGGTNAENIARTFAGGNRVRVAVAITNNRDAGVIKRMEAFHIPVLYFPNAVWSKEPQKIVEALKPYSIDLVALAGFMRRVAPEILEAYPGRVINIHPSLLPRHGGKGMYGHHVHEAVIADGDKESGVTVHYVTDEIDGGSIILQKSFPLAEGETAETLEAKIHPVEYEIFPQAIVKVISDLNKRGGNPGPAAGSDTAPAQVPSADEQWASALQLKYSDKEAAERRAEAEARAYPAPQAEAAQAVEPVQTASAADAPHQARNTERIREFARRPQSAATVMPAPAPAPAVAKPKSYIWVAVVMAIFFNTLLAVVAIVYACQVDTKWSCGDTAGAQNASNRAQGWIIASFVVGLLTATLWIPLSIIGSI